MRVPEKLDEYRPESLLQRQISTVTTKNCAWSEGSNNTTVRGKCGKGDGRRSLRATNAHSGSARFTIIPTMTRSGAPISLSKAIEGTFASVMLKTVTAITPPATVNMVTTNAKIWSRRR